MIARTAFAAFALAGYTTAAGAQQAAIPRPHPLPQPTTECRGCSDQHDSVTSSVGKYDEKKPGTISQSVRPDAKPAKVTPKKTVAKKHKHKHKTVNKSVANKSLTPPARPIVLHAKADSVRK